MMTCSKALLFSSILVLAAFSLSSCSGFKGTPCTVNCGVTGSGTLVLAMRSTPLTPPAGTNILSFVVQVTGISLTPSGGGSAVVISPGTVNVDFARLQSDSLLLAIDINVPAKSYTSMTIGFSAPTVTFCTSTSGTPGCTAGTVKTITGSVTTPQIPITLSVASSQKVDLEVNLDLATALTISNQAVTAVNLGAANALSTKTLPPSLSSLATGQIDFFENLLGVVTVATASQISVLTASQGTVTATPSSSTISLPNCVLLTSTTPCSPPAVGQFVSIDAAINSDGSLALLEFDPIDNTQIVWLEGVVTSVPSSTTQFQIVVTDESPNTTGGTTTLHTGEIINVTLAPAGAAHFIDAKGLPVPSNPFGNSTDATNILPGMTVGLHVITFTAPSGATPGSMTSDFVVLRFTPIPGSVAASGPTTFTLNSLPPFFGLTTNSVVQLGTGTPATNFDGVAGGTGLSSSQTVAIRALYLGPSTSVSPNLIAPKVRAF